MDGERFKISAADAPPLQRLLFDILDVIPDTARRSLRASALKPQDVHQMLLEFEHEYERGGFQAKKVVSLWKIFSTLSSEGVTHLPPACEAMASMLTRVGMLREVETLFSDLESQGLELGNAQIYTNLIEGYVGLGELSNAVEVYDKMYGQGLVPTVSFFHVFIDFLVRKREIQLAHSVCLDMVERAVNLSDESKNCVDSVVRLLCQSFKMHEVRKLLKKMNLNLQGWKPCNSVLNDIVRGYCEKKDFEDLISLYKELGLKPDTVSGNWIMHALCKSFGSREADGFRLKLEHLGFVSDEKTLGILIGWSCHEGNLKAAFFYLSEILARGLKPDLFSYNALICGVFKQGIWEHAFDILKEMIDKGIFPRLSSFKILLAGYCRARKFDKVRNTISLMLKFDLVRLSPVEDPVCKAFTVLGFDPLAVKLKRDCDAGLSRTEFYDNIGNGLYLETNLDEFDKKISQILEESTIPDFNSLLIKKCGHGKFRTALKLVDEMHSRGQGPSSSTLSALVKGLCLSQSSVGEINHIMDKTPILWDMVDEEALNLLVQFYCKKGFSRKGMKLMEAMFDRSLIIENETFTALVTSLCKKDDLRVILQFWDLGRKNNWIPSLKDVKPVLRCLCSKKLLNQAIELLERLLKANPFSQLYNMFFEELCSSGLTIVADLLAEEFLLRGCCLDNVAYGHLIRGFCLEKKHLEAVRVFSSIHMDSMVLDPNVLVLLIPSLCMTERFKEALALRDALVATNSFLSPAVQSALAEGYFRAGRTQEGIDLIWDLLSEGIYPSSKTNDTMVQAICQSKSMDKVEELLAFMIKWSIKISISTFRNIVRVLCMEGRIAHAVMLKQFMLGQRNTDVITVRNILIFYIFSSGQASLVGKVLDEENSQPDEFMYNLLVSGFARSKDTARSLHYLQTMISNGLRPSNRSLRSIISCLLNHAEFGLVTKLYQEMESRGWNSNPTIQNIIVNGLVSHGQVNEAETFVDRVVAGPSIPTGVIYDSFIKWLCKQGRMKKSVGLFNVMLKSQSVPDPSCYNALIHGFCTSDELDQAMDFYAEVLLRGFRPSTDTMETLVQKCCEKGRAVEAEGLLVSMSQIGVSSTRKMYCSIINRYRFENNPQKASELIQAMQRSGYEPDFETQWSLISTLNKPKVEEANGKNRGFLSRLLSRSGFSWKNDTKK